MRGSLRRAAPQRTQSTQAPVPLGGINVADSLVAMPPTDAPYLFNLLAENEGLTVRPGSVEWANGWTGGFGKSLIAFEGNSSSEAKLFVANEAGIWDVTTEAEVSPSQVVAFPSQAEPAGEVSYINFTNDGGDRFLLVCDAQNGYYTWAQATDTWTKIVGGASPGEIEGVAPGDLAFVMAWKNRVWFIEKDSAKAWYLDPQATTGTAAAFNFGSQFRSGGRLMALHNWTVDGGDGVDDYLVAISSAGDVVIYQGTDPAGASAFGLRGVWSLGAPPYGRRLAGEYGGELYILSANGLVGASNLLRGGFEHPQAYMTRKVEPLFRGVFTRVATEYGWQVHPTPDRSRLNIHTPSISPGEQWIFSYHVGRQAWSIIRGFQKAAAVVWQGNSYWTDLVENRVWVEQGDVDGVYLDAETDGDPQPITSAMLTHFSALDAPGRMKRVQFIRPVFAAQLNPNYLVRVKYDYDVSEIVQVPTATGDANVGLWGVGLWGVALWGGGAAAYSATRGGAGGMGTTAAIALRLSSAAPTTLVAFDVLFDVGGML